MLARASTHNARILCICIWFDHIVPSFASLQGKCALQPPLARSAGPVSERAPARAPPARPPAPRAPPVHRPTPPPAAAAAAAAVKANNKIPYQLVGSTVVPLQAGDLLLEIMRLIRDTEAAAVAMGRRRSLDSVVKVLPRPSSQKAIVALALGTAELSPENISLCAPLDFVRFCAPGNQ